MAKVQILDQAEERAALLGLTLGALLSCEKAEQKWQDYIGPGRGELTGTVEEFFGTTQTETQVFLTFGRAVSQFRSPFVFKDLAGP